MATIFKKGHFKNVQNEIGGDSFVLLLFQKSIYEGIAVIL